jgi:hypothetical protein
MGARWTLVGLVLLASLGDGCAKLATPAPVGTTPLDLGSVSPDALVRFEALSGALRATWPAGDGRQASVTLSLRPGAPLFDALAISPEPGAPPRVVATGLNPRYEVTVGSRVGTDRYVFLDNPASRPSTRARASLDVRSVRVEAHGERATITLSPIAAGTFSGSLELHLYAGSPLVHLQAAMAQPDPDVAYFFDAGLDGVDGSAAYVPALRPGDGPDADDVTRVSVASPRAPVSVRYRMIASESSGGSLVLFPAPHAFFFARDLSTNLSFVEAGDGTVGVRQAPEGGGNYSPWYDAPAGSTQRMDLFALVDSGPADAALPRARRYTRGDALPPMPGRVTFTSHWHSRLTASAEAGRPNAPELVRVLKRLGVNIIHLAEFHIDAHWDDPGIPRLEDQRLLFELARSWSDRDLLLIPGEEGVQHLGNPAPGEDPGHWMLLFPKPVYFTWHRDAGVPFVESLLPYGTVYHLDSRDDAYALLKKESALAWTSHPRIKASSHSPDRYRDQDFFLDDQWLGATWKAMPSDLSLPHLGDRSLSLLDEMRGPWGLDKKVLGEVDVFEVDRSHELYGYMNVNYLRLPAVPSFDDWSSVLEVLRRGDFFTTTGEVLVHDFEASADGARAELEWTLPLDHARVTWSKGGAVANATLRLDDTEEHGRRVFTWPLDLHGADWVRFEAWDVARDGAFTQPTPLTP